MNRGPKELKQIAALLHAQSTLALATTGEAEQPCVTPLFYIVDEDLSLFWFSSKASLHSENLQRNPHAAVTVYSHTDKWREIRGVVRGRATDLQFSFSPALYIPICGDENMDRSDFNPRSLKPGFEQAVYDLLKEILAKLKSIEQQMPNPRDFPDPRE